LDAKSETLIPIIRQKVVLDSLVSSDCWQSHNAFDVRDFKNCRINHSKPFLKKCEWRFNNSQPKMQLNHFKQWVKDYLIYLSGTGPKSFLIVQKLSLPPGSEQFINLT
jgi:transposase